MHLKISSAKWQPFCPGGDELTYSCLVIHTVYLREHEYDSMSGTKRVPGHSQEKMMTYYHLLLQEQTSVEFDS